MNSAVKFLYFLFVFLLLASTTALAEREPVRENLENLFNNWKKRFSANAEHIASNLLTLSEISVHGNERLDELDIIRAAGLKASLDPSSRETSSRETSSRETSGRETKTWFWGLNLAHAKERIEQLPWVEKASLKFGIYPLEMAIEVIESKPWLVAEFQGDSWLVGSSGDLIAPLSTFRDDDLVLEVSKLTRIRGLNDFVGLDSYLSSPNARLRHVVQGLRYLKMCGQFPFLYDEVELLSDGGLKVVPSGNAKMPAVIFHAKDFEKTSQAMVSLRSVLSDLEGRGEVAQLVDLRFENRAIVR